jgi:hypothetical protein
MKVLSRFILFAVITSNSLIGFAQRKTFCDWDYDSSILTKVNLLDSAFKSNDTTIKVNFLKEWSQLSEKYRNDYSVDDSIRFFIDYVLHDIYYPDTKKKRYYSKYNTYDTVTKTLDSIKIQYNGCFVDAEYFIVQTNVKMVYYPDSVFHDIYYRDNWYNKGKLTDTVIKDIYPDLKFLDKKILYLTDDYKTTLDLFTFCPDRRYPEYFTRDLKRIFLQPELELSKNHDGMIYHYITFPKIQYIQLNQDFNKALIHFRSSSNTGGIAKYEFVNGYWIRMEYDRERWIQ